MYQALYRKWRPRRFTDVAGQEHVTETLRRQVASGRLSHAYLFVGTRGTGKTTCAKILARAVNCERPVEGDPCNECPSCVGIEDGSILDVLELDAASNNGVDNVRALREEAIFTPATVKRRVYIIDEVHMLSPAAFNALLKIMEEPPEHLLFILATTELHKVPATILSRCQRFSFKRIVPEVIAERLKLVAESEGVELTADAAVRLARLGDGSMRDGLSLLDQCASGGVIDIDKVLTTIGIASGDETVRLVTSALARDTHAALSVLDKLYMDGKDMQSALSDMAALIRDALLLTLAPKGGDRLTSGVYADKTLKELSGSAGPERLFFCLDTIKDALASLSRGTSARLTAELCILRICDERLAGGEAALLSRLRRLEQMITAPERVESREAVPIPAVEPVITVPEPTIMRSEPTDTEVEAEPAAPEPAAVSDGWWEQILELLRDDISLYTVLSDGAQVSAQLHGSTLTVRAGNPFILNTMQNKTTLDALKRAAEQALGRAVTVTAAKDEGGTKAETSAIDRLGAFDIVKFE